MAIKGFRFHPTDEELIEFLQAKTSDRDSLVQVIDQVPDICQSEPWQLAESSKLQTGDRLWYFIYSPKYKYPNSKRLNRTTREGYWKPTGNARKVVDPETGRVIGSKKTLVYYKGQCNDNKIKTCWVIHEYELKVDPNSIGTDQKTFNLCKMKKRVDVSSTEADQSGRHNDCNQSGSVESSYVEERSNQHNMIAEDVVSNLYSTVVNSVAEDANSKETLHLKKMSKECNGPNDNNEARKHYNNVEKDDKSCSSILTDVDESVTEERSNQDNVVVAVEGFGIPSGFDYLADDNFIPMDFLYDDGLSFDELLEKRETTNNSDQIQDQSITDIEDIEFLNSILVDYKEAYHQEESRQQFLPTENEAFGLPCIGVIESYDPIEKPRKRPRLPHDGHVETTEAQVRGNISYGQ
ncbi:hypothetical protein HRI_003533200 [Hibiscus trionum]|uniref:NAC domain-containing protein n=1 Tax=Hibiscus trionum TaxID=183268 RepID=A0A9W7IL65_HIBTR|nr:hypothetical protein HRI_003533200 [Hibiscus trionum]